MCEVCVHCRKRRDQRGQGGDRKRTMGDYFQSLGSGGDGRRRGRGGRGMRGRAGQEEGERRGDRRRGGRKPSNNNKEPK